MTQSYVWVSFWYVFCLYEYIVTWLSHVCEYHFDTSLVSTNTLWHDSVIGVSTMLIRHVPVASGLVYVWVSCVYVVICVSIRCETYQYTNYVWDVSIYTVTYSCVYRHSLHVVFKWQVSFAEYHLFYRALLQKRPVIYVRNECLCETYQYTLCLRCINVHCSTLLCMYACRVSMCVCVSMWDVSAYTVTYSCVYVRNVSLCETYQFTLCLCETFQYTLFVTVYSYSVYWNVTNIHKRRCEMCLLQCKTMWDVFVTVFSVCYSVYVCLCIVTVYIET